MFLYYGRTDIPPLPDLISAEDAVDNAFLRRAWNHMRVAIVGSRKRNRPIDKAMVFALVNKLKAKYGDDLVLISGGCKEGADLFAEEAADKYHVLIDIHRPQMKPPPTDYKDACERYFARNEKIAADCDRMYALVETKRKGGTENAVGHARRLGKHVTLVFESGYFAVYQPLDAA